MQGSRETPMRRTSRLFEIIQLLRSAKKPLTAAALAEMLEVKKRTVYRGYGLPAGDVCPDLWRGWGGLRHAARLRPAPAHAVGRRGRGARRGTEPAGSNRRQGPESGSRDHPGQGGQRSAA